MTNQEIINAIDEILTKNDNLCDILMELKKIEKVYKKSDFFKTTKINLYTLVKTYQEYRLTNLNSLFSLIQEKINGLSLDSFTNILNQLSSVLQKDYMDLSSVTELTKDLFKDLVTDK